MASLLARRVCLITGASAGLGAHFARIVAAEGARVVLAARRSDRIEALAGELRKKGAECMAVAMDVTDERSINAGLDRAEKELGTVDTAIANAGVSRPGRSTSVPLATIQQVYDTNLLGVHLTARCVAARLLARGTDSGLHGRIVVIGSMLAEVQGHGDAAYSAGKAAVAQLGRFFAREWVSKGINVNVIQPGYILTEMASDWFASDKGRAQIAGMHRRRLQPIESLDATVLHLCSDASEAMTGAVLTIDDGQSL